MLHRQSWFFLSHQWQVNILPFSVENPDNNRMECHKYGKHMKSDNFGETPTFISFRQNLTLTSVYGFSCKTNEITVSVSSACI